MNAKQKKRAYDKVYRRVNRERIRAEKRANYAENRIEILARVSSNYRQNPEKIRAYNARYRNRNLKKLLLRGRQYYAANSSSIKDYQSRYRPRNADKIRCRFLEWYRNNPKRARLYKLRRRSLKLTNSTKEQMDAADRKIRQMLSKERSKCGYCPKILPTRKMHVDHITPLSRGGPHAPHNLVMACPQCNCSKGSRLLGSEWNPKRIAA